MPKYKHGSGSVYKRGKTWWIKYYVGGKAVYESSSSTDKAEARRFLQSLLGQVADERYVGPAAERVTFEDLAEGLLNDYRVNGKKSLREVRIRLEKHLCPFFVGKRAHDITAADIRAFIAQRKKQGASNAEVNRELAALKRAFNLAMQAEQITKKPAHIPHLAENNVRQGFFEPWEFTAMLARLPEYLRPPMTFAYYTGWRRGEILALTWDRVDIENGTVRLYRGTDKNTAGRVIALPQVLKSILDQQWQQHLTSSHDCLFVFL